MSPRSLPRAVLWASVLLWACGDGASGPSPTKVVTVAVSPGSASIAVGQTRQFSATPLNGAGVLVAGKSALWASTNPQVATVDASGLARGVGPGTATITATVDGTAGPATLTVVALPVATVTITPASATVAVQATAQLAVALADSLGGALTDRPVTWSSASTAVATVSGTGLVTGVAAGSTRVTATSEGRSASITVTVVPNPAVTLTVTGRVVEAAGAPSVPGARVTAQDANGTFVSTTTADASGAWAITGVAAGSVLQFAVSAPGFVSTTVAAAAITSAVPLEAIPLARTSAATGTLSGRARDASTNAPIGVGLAVELRPGVNAVTGLAVQVTTTAADGSFTLGALAAGTYTLLMRGPGYVTSTRTVAVSGGATATTADLALSANVNATQWRAVLTWTAPARDLDLYLTLPGAGTARQQVYFLQPGNCAAPPFACLDRDASAAPGPETITITQVGAGTYRFYVHNYNTPSSASDSTLLASGAQLRLFRGTAQVGTYNVPSQPGTLWTVVELDGATGALTARNVMTAGGPGDPTAALRAPADRSGTPGKRDAGLRLP